MCLGNIVGGGGGGGAKNVAAVQPVKRMATERVAADFNGAARRARDQLRGQATVLTSARGLMQAAPTQMKTLLGGA